MRKNHLVLLLAASTLSMAAFFNTDLRTRIQEGLLHYIRTQLPEKVYVQTDKPYYTSGETIWFKAYLMEAVAHTPNSKSRVVYVDLINPEEEILATCTLYSYEGGAAGDFALADSLTSGTYLLRAYTQHMRNSDADYFFTKEIPVYYQTAEEVGDAKLVQKTTPTESTLLQPDIQFLPEGGELVDGLPTVVGIKAMTADGQSVETSGKIVDTAGEVVAFFKTYQFGLGFARLTPKAGEQYKAVAVVNGVEYVYGLPKVRVQGYVLTIDNSGKKIRFRMSTNRPQGLTDMLLVGHVRGQLFCTVEGEADKSMMVGELSTKDIPDGVAHFTLFTAMGVPVCERLVFVDHPDNDVEVAITTDQQIYETRQAVKVTLDVEGLTEEEFANLSLSVTDQVVVKTPMTVDNIKSWLLLNSDLKGAIEQPGYYFTEPMTDERRRLLDLLLLTQGWRRFVWKEVLEQDVQRPRYEVEDGIYIKGTATKWQKPEQPVTANVVLSFLDEELYMEDQTTSANGKFEFGPFFFPDTASIILQARIPKKTENEGRLLDGKRNTSIYLAEQNDPPVQWPPTRTTPLSAPADFLATSQQAKITDRNYDTSIIDLEGVTVTAKRKPKDAYREITNDHGSPTNRLPVADDPGMVSLPNIYQLFGRIPGVQVQGTSVSIRNQPAQFILDGIPISTAMLETLLPSEILVIDVYKGADLFFGSGAGLRGNVIAIHTRQARDVAPVQRNQAGIEAIDYPGFYLARAFYSPNYAQRQPEHVKPDYRTTLFWAPELRVQGGTASVTFYTSDQPSTYQIEVEGITSAGRVVRSVEQFEVR